MATKTRAAAIKSQEAVLGAVDQNGNGEIDIEDVIIMGLKTPGIRINQDDFLRKEFQSKYPQEIIDDAVAYNPLHAGMSAEVIDKIADEVTKYERACVSGISAALGMPDRNRYGRHHLRERLEGISMRRFELPVMAIFCYFSSQHKYLLLGIRRVTLYS